MTCMRARTSSNFGQIRPRAVELWPLKDVRNWFLLNILRMDGQNLTKFCIHIIIDKTYIATVKRHFSQICNRVTALDRCQNWFLLNIMRMDGQNLTKFCIHFIIDKIYVCIVKGYFLQICNRVTALDVRNCFCSISWEWIDRIQPNFVYTLSWTRSRLFL